MTPLVTDTPMSPPKIVDRTLMMMQATTMTIHSKWEKSYDIFHNLDWPLFNYDKGIQKAEAVPEICILSHLCYASEIPENIGDLDAECSKQTHSMIFNNPFLKPFKVYLFVAHSSWLQKTRLSLYKKLWKSLPDHWNIFDLSLGNEWLFESESGIRFAGLSEIDPSMFDKAVTILRSHLASVLIMTQVKDFNEEEMVQLLFRTSFPEIESTGIDWSNLVLHLCVRGDIVIRLSGSNDERLTSLDFIMLNEKMTLFDI